MAKQASSDRKNKPDTKGGARDVKSRDGKIVAKSSDSGEFLRKSSKRFSEAMKRLAKR